jgi:hypothetical protein
MKMLFALGCMVLVGASISTRAALVLNGTSYTQNFDGIGSGLPTGWSVNTGATISGTGSAAILTTGATSWASATGQFQNSASSDDLGSSATSGQQSASLDRALGIRQTGTFGDPGAAFELNIQNTTGYDDFSLSISLQMLGVQSRSTAWTIDYRIGDSGNFTPLATYSDPGIFGSTLFTANSSTLSSWNNQSQDVWFRVVALNPSTGSGSRDTFAIDDFSLTYSAIAAVPESAETGLISATGLLVILSLDIWRRRAVMRLS